MPDDPDTALQELRDRIHGGARLLLDSLSEEELGAVHALIREGEAEIINEACNRAKSTPPCHPQIRKFCVFHRCDMNSGL
jgi:hypothetical protein